MSLFHHEFVRFIGKSVLSRRSFLQHVSAGQSPPARSIFAN